MMNDKTVYACDISDSGTLRIWGSGARGFLRAMCSAPLDACVSLMDVCQGLLLSGQGEVIDVVQIICTGDDEFLMLTSGSNTEEVFEWLEAHAELKDGDDLVFGQVAVSDESSKMAIMVLYGPGCPEVLKQLGDACMGQPLFMSCNFDKPAYGIPLAPGALLFVPMNLASQFGDLLNENLDLEVVDYEHYVAQLLAQGLYCKGLADAQYHQPAELGLEWLMRDENDFVGARALSK